VSDIVGSMVNVEVAETSADMDSDNDNVLDRLWDSVSDKDIVESGVTVFVSETSCDSVNVTLRVSEKLWESDTLTVCVINIVGSMV